MPSFGWYIIYNTSKKERRGREEHILIPSTIQIASIFVEA